MNKLPYLKKLWDRVPITVYLTKLGRNGNTEVVNSYDGLCNFSESGKRVKSSNGEWVHLAGIVHIGEDIFPDAKHIEGYVIFRDKKYHIENSSRPRNPDGTVNHTRLELR